MIYLDTLETKIPRTDKNSSETYSIRLTNIQTNESKTIDNLVDKSTYLYYYQFVCCSGLLVSNVVPICLFQACAVANVK